MSQAPRDRRSSPDVAPAPATEMSPSRRRFLFALSAGGAGAAAAATQAVAAPLSGAGVAEATQSGYRETEHVRDYYATARL